MCGTVIGIGRRERVKSETRLSSVVDSNTKRSDDVERGTHSRLGLVNSR